MHWIPLNQIAQISEIQQSDNISLLFKHSTRCHISAMSLKFFEREWEEQEGVNTYFIDLIADRAISNAVAETFQVYHESPQVLLIYKGECIYDESHQGIQASELLKQIKAIKQK